MLWKRVVALDDAPEKHSDPISLTLQVSRDESFDTALVERTVAAPGKVMGRCECLWTGWSREKRISTD